MSLYTDKELSDLLASQDEGALDNAITHLLRERCSTEGQNLLRNKQSDELMDAWMAERAKDRTILVPYPADAQDSEIGGED